MRAGEPNDPKRREALMGQRRGTLGYIGKSSEREEEAGKFAHLAGSPHEHEMPGDARC